MAFVGWPLVLFLLAHLHLPAARSVHHTSPAQCLPNHANALLKLKQSFVFKWYSTTTLSSWQAGTDCCLWEGVGCGNPPGHVTALNLSGFELKIPTGIDPVLFNLTSLRMLDLSMNNFDYSYIPSVGIERLTLLTHLNLSGSAVRGQVPSGISRLTNLISLDLSCIDDSFDKGGVGLLGDLSEFNFHDLVVNLTNLRELILDGVGISSRLEDCLKDLAKSTPYLRVLSLEYCKLEGHIDLSLSRLRKLEIIKLSGNYGMTPGPFPEFIMNFVNLSVLRLADINLEGWFPRGIFQSKNLRVLDLSRNPNLLGHMPIFSNASSLEILRLDMTNFSYAIESKSTIDFNSIMEFGVDGNFISLDFPSSFSIISVSLRKLVLTRIRSQTRNSELVFSWIQDMGNLTRLVLHKCDSFTATTSSLENSDSNDTTRILSAVTDLKSLKGLSIVECNFSEPLSSTIGNMSNLEILDIIDCQIIGPMPREVGKLKNLKSLSIWGFNFLGPLPSTIGNISNLETLDIIDSQINGPIPHEVGALKKLTVLQLQDTGLSGDIPNSIGNLTRLTQLSFDRNRLTGKIPTSVFTLPVLQDLYLQSNQLSGPIPNMITSRLESIDLSGNKLMGQIPESLFLMTNLNFLDISGNNLTGSVDLASLWRLEKLTYISLSNNKLSIVDGEASNSSWTFLSMLQELYLANCNITKMPKSLIRINHLYDLDLSNNKLSGDIPKWIWERWYDSLRSLNLSHNMFTGMELTSYAIPFTSRMYIFDISSNMLQGQIPMPSLSIDLMDYSDNRFSSIPQNFTSYLGDTKYFSLSKNNITGYLPVSICDLYLVILDVSYNNFKGKVPPCLIYNGYTSILNLGGNQFEGVLPSNNSSGCSLQTLDLHDNKIEGQVPRALSNCIALEVLDLGRNKITDTFPSWLRTLLNLRVLILRSNKFQGSINYLKDEKYGENFRSLQILDLASNNFSGKLHPRWFENLLRMEKYDNTGQIMRHQNLSSIFTMLYQDTVTISYKGSYVTFGRILTTLTAIDLSDNALEGNIPASIGKLVSLRVLNMSHNALTGEIPRQFGGVTSLESLDLSLNMLTGEIPQELTNLTFLSILNLSDNHLEGRIPQSHQFTTFESGSFDGNAGLCGQPLSKQCGTQDTPNESHMKSSCNSVDIVLFLFVGLGFGMGFALSFLVKVGWIKRWFCSSNLTNMI